MASPWDSPDFDAHEGLHLFDDPSSSLRRWVAARA